MKRPLLLSATLLMSALSAAAKSPSPRTGPPCQKPDLSAIALVLDSPDFTCEVTFNALILQPFANNVDYGAEAVPFNYGDAQPAISPSWVIPEIPPGFHFGFDLGIMGVFHDAASNLMVNWERYHSSNDTNTLTVGNIDYMFGPFFEIGPDASPYKTGTGKVNCHLDAVNIDYGTFVNFGNRIQTNLFSGVGFARLVEHRFTTFSDLDHTVIRTIDVPAKFIGAGPQVGFAFDYKIVKGFRFVGVSRATLFVGNFSNSTTFSTTSNDLALLGDENPNIQTTSVDTTTGIVPAFESKLGFAYEVPFCRTYLFKIEAGYQAQVLINAIRSIDMGSEVALGAIGSVGSATTGVYARSFERTVSDFGLAGPYVTVDFAF